MGETYHRFLPEGVKVSAANDRRATRTCNLDLGIIYQEGLEVADGHWYTRRRHDCETGLEGTALTGKMQREPAIQ
jgi:hypothetical protein